MKSRLDNKMERQNLIRYAITHNVIETQSDLVAALQQMGYEVTQSTISREIREMGLTKTLKPDGVYCYTLPRERKPVTGRFSRMLTDSVLEAETAMNLVVVKTLSGSANMVAEAIDSSAWTEVVGTLAGDNTIFIATRSIQEAERLKEKILQMMTSPEADRGERAEGVSRTGEGQNDSVASYSEYRSD